MKMIQKIKNKFFNNTIIENDTEIINTNNYPKEVLEIHHEFENASKKLIKEAQKIINDKLSPSLDNKNKLLKQAGFINVPEFINVKNILEEQKLNKELINLINYYSVNYPFNKFITEEQVKEICHKYNLVCGDVERFKGFVPEKNLKEIINFKLKDKDKILIGITKSGKTLYFEDAVVYTKPGSNYCRIYKKGDEGDYSKHAFRGNCRKNLKDISFYSSDSNNIFGYAHLGPLNFRLESSEDLKICAPVKDMDISDLQLEEGYKLVKKHIPDPVVLQPVKGGYLIITAWGDEASDPLVINPLMN